MVSGGNRVYLYACMLILYIDYVQGKGCAGIERVHIDQWGNRDREIRDRLEGGDRWDDECIGILGGMGLWNSAQYLAMGGGDREKIRAGIHKIKTELDDLYRQAMQGAPRVHVSPAIKWGQSYEDILLYIKFAPRIDAPGCLDLSDRVVRVDANNSLHLSARGILAGAAVQFGLDIPLYNPVQGRTVQVESAGVGAITVKIRKSKIGIWPYLYTKNRDNANVKVSVWWDLRDERYRAGMEEYGNIHKKMDQVEEEEIIDKKDEGWGDWMKSGLKNIWNKVLG